MKLKLDENLGNAAVELFRNAGHEVETVASEGLAGANDEAVIAASSAECRVLITLDRDFGNPLIFKPWDYSGIAVLRLPSKPCHYDLMTVCRTLIEAMRSESIVGKLWSVERGRVRQYRPNRWDDENLA